LESTLSEVDAHETVFPASEVQEAMGRNTLKNHILKESVDIFNAKIELRPSLYCPMISSQIDGRKFIYKCMFRTTRDEGCLLLS
jgi:hypothetical protein